MILFYVLCQVPYFHSRGLIGRLFPYTSHVIFTDLSHSNLNDVRKDTFSSERSAMANADDLFSRPFVGFCHTIVYYGGHSHVAWLGKNV